jgi:uncharacterized membrane protein
VSTAQIGVLAASFVASAVEFVEALTIVLAMGLTRSWRAALWGAAAAAALLGVVTVIFGGAVASAISRTALQLVVGVLLLLFGVQWLRKAMLRFAGLKALHDEDATFREEQEAARAAPDTRRFGLDWFAFTVSFKGVLLEGLEVVFIVVTFGASAHSIPLAAAGAAIAAVLVIGAGIAVHRPLARVPENAMKYVVGLMLCTFGTFWTGEGLGVATSAGDSLQWPGGDLALPLLLAAWLLASQLVIAALRPLAPVPSSPAASS